jgi:F-type H+-transporting ATPase subunit alpha
MVELLKQDQFVPMSGEDQIAVIFAGTSGYLDDIPVEAVKKFEEEMLGFMKSQKADIMKEIEEKKAMDEDLKGKLSAAIEEFKKGFSA